VGLLFPGRARGLEAWVSMRNSHDGCCVGVDIDGKIVSREVR
jgi:hypothetical protein